VRVDSDEKSLYRLRSSAYCCCDASVARRYGQVCPVAESLDLVGERWTLLIVRDLSRGPVCFQDLRTMLPGIPTKLLSERLQFMIKQGLVARKFYSDYPPRARYALSEKERGLSLVVGALAAWGGRQSNRRLSVTTQTADARSTSRFTVHN